MQEAVWYGNIDYYEDQCTLNVLIIVVSPKM
jgi:hypothetical protein